MMISISIKLNLQQCGVLEGSDAPIKKNRKIGRKANSNDLKTFINIPSRGVL